MIELITATQLDYFDNLYIEAKGDAVTRDDYIVAETKRGFEMLRVVKSNYRVPKDNIVEPDGRFVRRATDEDVKTFDKNDSMAREALSFCKEATVQEKLDMQLVNAKYTLDRKKLIFNFTADERVDFRSLVRILANRFKTRIELRQIGVRDEAKYLGGIGPCGRAHCCSTFLGDFVPVSIQMAKNQDLSLSPTKISGACGRLMCCLNFEDEYYEDAREQMPDVGQTIDTPDGRAVVIGMNILDLVVKVKYKDDYIREYHCDELNAAGGVQ
ncbi:stage 0 sporulation family protein [Salinicoccus cyprini]|uniref:Stage 0 sporulation family protein n=1 Tax=Salinicoccus cyprini TaxID=2493691 RepID=A0A558ARM8_9STAP|nr:stage 0 sporulation family protein [Salinicoccus cyprini]TVT26912.1 stage 0 sporulation family protein [Salinicoccus cyprini]